MKRGVVQHPKFEGLMRAMQEPKRSIVGMLELLWHATEMYHDDGGIGRWSDVNIAGAMDWHGGDARQLISTLIDVGWLDRVDDGARLVVHDWLSHAPNHVWSRVKKRVERAIAAEQNIPTWLHAQYERAKVERNKDQAVDNDDGPPGNVSGRGRFVRPRPAASGPNPRPKTLNPSNLKLDGGAVHRTATPPPAVAEDQAVVLEFACRDGQPWQLTDDHLRRLQADFRNTRVMDCLRALRSRQIDEPEKVKSAAQMPSFLRNWLKIEERDERLFSIEPSEHAPRDLKPSRAARQPSLEDRARAVLEKSS